MSATLYNNPFNLLNPFNPCSKETKTTTKYIHMKQTSILSAALLATAVLASCGDTDVKQQGQQVTVKKKSTASASPSSRPAVPLRRTAKRFRAATSWSTARIWKAP